MTKFDGVLRALSDCSRRKLLIALLDEEHIHPFSGDGDKRDQSIQYHHVHLPLLEESGLIVWDRDTGTVRRGDDFEAVEPVLTALEVRRDALPDDYLPEEGLTC